MACTFVASIDNTADRTVFPHCIILERSRNQWTDWSDEYVPFFESDEAVGTYTSLFETHWATPGPRNLILFSDLATATAFRLKFT